MMSIWRAIAILLVLAHCGCGGFPEPTDPPPGEGLALALVAQRYADAGFPLDFSRITVTWWSDDDGCLLDFKVDTQHWTLKDTCVHGIALGCQLQVIRPTGEHVISRSSLAHELFHCVGFQRDGIAGLDVNHTRPEWQTLVPTARVDIYDRGF